MSRQEAYGQYNKALRMGQKYYRDCVVHGILRCSRDAVSDRDTIPPEKEGVLP